MRPILATSVLLLGGCWPQLEVEPTGFTLPILTSDEDSPLSVCAPERKVTVDCTVDGDTFDIGGCGASDADERFRMLGIDTPETAKPGTAAECYGDESAAVLDNVLRGERVTLSFDTECEGVFGRTLAWVELDLDDARRILNDDPGIDEVLDLTNEQIEDQEESEIKVNLNVWMVLQGHAFRFDEEWVEPVRYERALVAAERLAQLRRRGVWQCP